MFAFTVGVPANAKVDFFPSTAGRPHDIRGEMSVQNPEIPGRLERLSKGTTPDTGGAPGSCSPDGLSRSERSPALQAEHKRTLTKIGLPDYGEGYSLPRRSRRQAYAS